MNHIILNGLRVKERYKKQGIHYILSDNSIIINKDIVSIETECPKCGKFRKLKKLWYFNFKKPSVCFNCNGSIAFKGKKHSDETKSIISKKNKEYYSNNPPSFLGKYHSLETKAKLSKINKLKENTGKNNPFFGKKHTQKTKDILVLKNKEYWENISIDQLNELKHKMSLGQKRILKENPEKYKKMKSNAGKISHLSNIKYKKNKIEQIVHDELFKRNLNFEYSIILDYKQFDFGNKENKVLLEVNGDYWHGNPEVYTKEKLNYIQLKVIERDKLKADFCTKHNLKLYIIWEKEINNNNFTILDNIKSYINEI